MTVKFTNNANSTLASGINSSVTSMTVADASSFPSLSGANDYCYLTLQESGGTTREIVKATALSSNTFTVVRGQDNTSAATWSSGILVELRITSALLQDVIDGLGSGSMMDTDIFAGDGSDTTFTLSRQPDNENNLLIFIDGVFQAHNAYSVSGTTLTLSAAPANGRVITAYHMATTVGGSNLIKATMTGDNSDTTLDVGSQIIHENNVQVYFDGVYQSKGNYSVSGSVITFSTAPPTGVAVEAILNTATNISTAAQLTDADNDTLIQVEESADEDKIRFDTAGTQRMILDSTSLTVTPKIVSDAGIDIDNINIDGTTIALSSGDLTLDVAGDINLDADGGDINFKDGGTLFGQVSNSSGLYLVSSISDADIFIRGNDGGSMVNALTFDMSAAGAAAFNSYITSTAVYGKDDGNTGIQFDGSDVTTLHTGGTERMRIDSAGKVGIGTASPTGLPLHLKVSSGDNKLQMQTANKNAYVMELEDSTGNLKLGTNSIAGSFVLRDDGNVGIGSAGMSVYSGYTQLSVGQMAHIMANTAEASSGSLNISTNAHFDADGSWETMVTGHASNYYQYNGGHYWRVSGSTSAGTDISWHTTKVLTDTRDHVINGDPASSDYRDGRLATNITTAGQRFYVFTSSNLDARFNAYGSNGAYLGVFAGGTRLNNDAGYFVFGNNTNANGGSWNAYFQQIVGSDAATGKIRVRTCDGSSWHSACEFTNGGTHLTLTNSGGVGTISDQRLKKNIQDLTFSLDTFKALRPRQFEWINPEDRGEGVINGFVAQEMPEQFVQEHTITKEDDVGSGEKEPNPDYELVKDTDGKIFATGLGQDDAMYVSVIQQLIAKVETLEAEVKALKEA